MSSAAGLPRNLLTTEFFKARVRSRSFVLFAATAARLPRASREAATMGLFLMDFRTALRAFRMGWDFYSCHGRGMRHAATPAVCLTAEAAPLRGGMPGTRARQREKRPRSRGGGEGRLGHQEAAANLDTGGRIGSEATTSSCPQAGRCAQRVAPPGLRGDDPLRRAAEDRCPSTQRTGARELLWSSPSNPRRQNC